MSDRNDQERTALSTAPRGDAAAAAIAPYPTPAPRAASAPAPPRATSGRSHASATDPAALLGDLAFAFGVMQIGFFLSAHLTALGLLQAAMLGAAVWRVWTDGEATRAATAAARAAAGRAPPSAGRAALASGAAAAAAFAAFAAAPEAFLDRGLVFACAYAAIGLGRWGALVLRLGPQVETLRMRARVELALRALSASAWVGGGFLDPADRMTAWAFAATLDVAAPRLTAWAADFRSRAAGAPGSRRTNAADASPSGGAPARRRSALALAMAVALLTAAATASAVAWTPAALVAFAAVLVRDAALLWIIAEPDAASRGPSRERAGLAAAGVALCMAADAALIQSLGFGFDAVSIVAAVGGPLLVVLGAATPIGAPRFADRGGAVRASVGLRGAAVAAYLGLGFAAAALGPLLLGVGVALATVSTAAWRSLSAAELRRVERPAQSTPPPPTAAAPSTAGPKPTAPPPLSGAAAGRPADAEGVLDVSEDRAGADGETDGSTVVKSDDGRDGEGEAADATPDGEAPSEEASDDADETAKPRTGRAEAAQEEP